MKREHAMTLRLDEAELAALTGKAKKAGMSREAYCRTVLNGSEVMEAPSADVDQLIHEIRRVGRNVDQLLTRANTFGFIDTELMHQVLGEAMVAEQKIVDAYTGNGS